MRREQFPRAQTRRTIGYQASVGNLYYTHVMYLPGSERSPATPPGRVLTGTRFVASGSVSGVVFQKGRRSVLRCRTWMEPATSTRMTWTARVQRHALVAQKEDRPEATVRDLQLLARWKNPFARTTRSSMPVDKRQTDRHREARLGADPWGRRWGFSAVKQ